MSKISEYSSSLFFNPGLIMSFSGTHKSFDTETCETESWKMLGLLFVLPPRVSHATMAQISILLFGISTLNVSIVFFGTVVIYDVQTKVVSKKFIDKPSKIDEDVAK